MCSGSGSLGPELDTAGPLVHPSARSEQEKSAVDTPERETSSCTTHTIELGSGMRLARGWVQCLYPAGAGVGCLPAISRRARPEACCSQRWYPGATAGSSSHQSGLNQTRSPPKPDTYRRRGSDPVICSMCTCYLIPCSMRADVHGPLDLYPDYLTHLHLLEVLEPLAHRIPDSQLL